MSAKEKGKFEDMAKVDKAPCERVMKTNIPPKGKTKRKFKYPNALKRPPSTFSLFCSEYRPQIKGEHPGLSIDEVAKKLGEIRNNTAASDKQPYEKAAEWEEKYEKDIAPYRAKGKPDAVKKGVVKAENSKKKKEEEEDMGDEKS
ncbi:High mobility group protein B1 [Tupaia chinensis]|uniref:High mobility group protein B1 n=1 Tax=Tupaia chinensis TaxID=246437 RepID=L9L6X1_TUPCH|nr:High mobility group protein B1 [Tupaia chinensis]